MQYDYNALYGQADTSAGQLIEAGNYDAVVEKAEWGPTSAGDKGTWVVRFRITTGQYAGAPLTTNMTVSPTKSDGEVNSAGLGMLFRQLGAMGIPSPQEQPQWWGSAGVENQIAQIIVGKPVQLRVIVDTDYDPAGRNKVKDIRMPRPGAPLDWPRSTGQQGAQQGYQPGAVPGQAPAAVPGGQNPYGPPQGQFTPPPQQGWGPPPQQPAAPSWGGPEQQPGQPPAGPSQPWNPAQDPSYGQPPAPPAGQPSPWNAPPQQGPTQPAYGGQPQNAGPGYGSAPTAPAAGQPGYPPQGPQGWSAPAGGAPAQGAPPQQGAPSPSSPQIAGAPGWAQPQAQPGYQDPNQPPQGNGYPNAPQNGQQQAPQGGPALPPWAQ